MERTVNKIKLDDIWMDEVFNSRDKIQVQHVIDLARSIKADGLINPILVQRKKGPKGETYKVIAGHRRTKACLLLKTEDETLYDSIEAFIADDDMSEQQARILNLNENLARKDLSILEEAKSLIPLMELGMSETDIVNALPSATRGWVQVRMMLLKLPKEVQEEANVKLINQTQIRDLYTLMINGMPDTCLFDEVKKAKDAKLKGETYQIKVKKHTRNAGKSNVTSKHARSRSEIFTMIKHLLDNDFEGLPTRTLAWAAGEISDLELFVDLEDDNPNYKRPKEGIDYGN